MSEPFRLRRSREAQWRPTELSGARDTEHIGRWRRDFLACSESRAHFQQCVRQLGQRAGHIARRGDALISVTVLVENKRLGYFVTGAPRWSSLWCCSHKWAPYRPPPLEHRASGIGVRIRAAKPGAKPLFPVRTGVAGWKHVKTQRPRKVGPALPAEWLCNPDYFWPCAP